MATHRQHFKLFLASSNDVKAERDLVPGVVDRANRIVGDALGKHLELYRWEDRAAPMLHRGGPQQLINPDLDTADVVLLVCWSKLGDGVTEEIERSLARWEKHDTPQVMAYFSSEPWPHDIDVAQIPRIRALKERLGEIGLFWDYDGPAAFGTVLFDHLCHVLPKLGGPQVASVAPPRAPASGDPALSRAELTRVVDIALRHRADRGLLLGFLPHALVARLPHQSSPLDQLNSDVRELNGMPLVGDELPIVTWLRNLHQRVSIFPESRDVQALIDRLV